MRIYLVKICLSNMNYVLHGAYFFPDNVNENLKMFQTIKINITQTLNKGRYTRLELLLFLS